MGSTRAVVEELQAQERIAEADRQAVLIAIANERDAAIRDIHDGVVEVNELTRDLQSMVAEQAPVVDSIVDHVANADAHATSAVMEIKKSDKRLRSKTCIVL